MTTEPIVRLSARDFDNARLTILRELTGFERMDASAEPEEDRSIRPPKSDLLGVLAGAASLAR
jgi:hypothetical protein